MNHASLQRQQLNSSDLFGDCQLPDPPLCTLKNLRQNLSFLQQQYYMRISHKHQQHLKNRTKHSSVPIRIKHSKENSQLPRISSTNYHNGLAQKKKRSLSIFKQSGQIIIKEDSSINIQRRKGVKQFSELKGLFPLEGKQQKVFLHKHKNMNISKAIHINRLRNRTSTKVFMTTLEVEQKKRDRPSMATLVNPSPRML